MTVVPIKNPFDFILPRDHEDYADSTVIGIIGPKRSNKSLLLAMLLNRDMNLGRKVWSTMDVHTPKYFIDRGYPLKQTMPVDWDAFFRMSSEYQNGTIGIDEASAFNSNRSTLSSKNRVTNAFTNQVGHRSIDVIWTAKSTGWLDKQGLGFETDIEIECMDLAKSRYGKQNHIKKGTIAYFEAWDRSGALTGRPAGRNDKNARPFKRWYWDTCSRYWDSYDTRYLLKVEDIFGGVKMDMLQRVVSNKPKAEDLKQPVLDIARKIAVKTKEIQTDAFRAILKDSGITVNDRLLGQINKAIGITKKQRASGYFYELEGLANE